MSKADVETSPFKVVGKAECVGGDHPNPSLDAYPLLAWTKEHSKHGYMSVHLEDQSASVEQVALALVELHTFEAVASKFGTSADHVSQAIDYAVKAGFLGS